MFALLMDPAIFGVRGGARCVRGVACCVSCGRVLFSVVSVVCWSCADPAPPLACVRLPRARAGLRRVHGSGGQERTLARGRIWAATASFRRWHRRGCDNCRSPSGGGGWKERPVRLKSGASEARGLCQACGEG
jgi:hypothetical protein